MNLKKHLTKQFATLSIIFAITILLITGLFFHLNSSINKLILESDPTLDAMEHMLLDVYRDNIILLDYLNTIKYDQTLSIDEQVEDNTHQCSIVENNIENLIITGVISDPIIIEDYNLANIQHDQVEALRDDLIALHKRELANGINLKEQKQQLLEQHSDALALAVNSFTQNIEKIELRNDQLRKRLIVQTRIYLLSIILLLTIFVVILIVRVRSVTSAFITPIDQTIQSIKTYVDGNYKERIKPTYAVKEIGDLQRNVNNVFSVIEQSAKDPKQAKKIKVGLLRKQFVEILDILSANENKGKLTTISDLKKELRLTHPTILSRLKYLEQNSYIKITKHGREKVISL